MKIGFKQLERLRMNPKSVNDKNAFFGGRSKFMRWQDAIARFHSKGDNITEAQKYLEATFARLADNSLNKRDLKKYMEHLSEYEVDYKALKSQKIEYRMSFSFDIPLGHVLGGQISRVDINTNSDGYSIYSFEKDIDDWEDELRFPLLQSFVADFFGCFSKEVNVGIYHLNDGKHYSKSFPSSKIKEAQKELNEVITEVNKFLKK